MIRLSVAFVDGTVIEKEYPNHEVESVELMIEGTPEDLLSRVELEDHKETIIYFYKRKTEFAF